MEAKDVKTELDFQIFFVDKWQEIMAARAKVQYADFLYSPRYNDYFDSIEEARFYRALYFLTLKGIDAQVPPFPTDPSPLYEVLRKLASLDTRLALIANTGKDLRKSRPGPINEAFESDR